MIILGAGVSGICMAKKLDELGVRLDHTKQNSIDKGRKNYFECSYTILEKSESLGGTWWDNTYPGAACDISSHLYSFSFFPNPYWSRAYSHQKEILEYLQDTASR